MDWKLLVAFAATFQIGSSIYGQGTDPGINSNYEYIVVGSGPGGGPLACRLARAGHSVLLIDAGDDQRGNLDYQVPAFQARVAENPLLQWKFYVRHYSDDTKAFQSNKATWTTPDGSEYVGNQPPPGSTYKGVLYPRAASLGGSFSHHALITITPCNEDWRQLQTITGDVSWNPSNMREYFKKIERNQYVPTSVVGHGFDGWLADEVANPALILDDNMVLSWLYAAAATFTNFFRGPFGDGFSELTRVIQILSTDPNRPTSDRDEQEGFYQLPLSTNNHARNGPADFIADTMTEGYPLTFMNHTLVTRILFDTTGPVPCAIGVEFLQGKSLYSADPRYNKNDQGTPGSVRATKEVIISGGTFNTPQILKLSGIGPKEELTNLGMPVLVDLPGVGANMQDRYENAINYKTDKNFTILKGCEFGYVQPDPCLIRWQTDMLNRGMYTSDGLLVAGIVKSSVAALKTKFPKLCDLFFTGGPIKFYGYYTHWDRVAVADHKHWSWVSLKAHSRNHAGTVKLRSTDPRDTPDINFHYFSEGSPGWELDKQALVEGLERIRRIHDRLPPYPFTDYFVEEQPGSNGPDLETYAELSSWGHHACCTSAIGADDDPMAVLDTNFKVRGTNCLRVVDASVFKYIPGYFLAVPVLMISEKAADVILQGK